MGLDRIKHMFELVDVSRMAPAEVLGVLEAVQRTRRLVEVQEALALLRLVRSYRHGIATGKVRLGAEGTPLIDECYVSGHP